MKNRLDSQVIANYRGLVAAGEYLCLADSKLKRVFSRLQMNDNVF